jgi:hypothetical protein
VPSTDCQDAPDAVDDTHLALFVLSCTILCLFLTEISMTIFALGVDFFKNPLASVPVYTVCVCVGVIVFARTVHYGCSRCDSIVDD